MTRCSTKSISVYSLYKDLLRPWSVILFGLFFVLMGCDQAKEPEFVKVSKVKPEKIGRDTIILSCNAIYKNPNPIGGELISTDIDVYVNDIFVTHINQDLHTLIEANEEFNLPLTIKVPVKTLIQEKGNLLDQVLKTLVNRSFNLKYDGEARFKFAKIPLTIPINREEIVKIKI